MVDGFNGLGHDAVVGSDHQNGNIGAHGAALTHGGKGSVTGRIQEGQRLTVHIHGVSADMLGNAAGFAGDHIGLTHSVQKRGLTMVNMAHDDHNRASGDQIFRCVFMIVDQTLFNGDNDLLFHLAAQFFGCQRSGIIVDGLVDRGHDAQVHQQILDDLSSGLLHSGSQLANGDLIGNLHHQRCLLGDLHLQTAHLFLILVAALVAAELVAVLLLVLVLNLLLAAGIILSALRDQHIHTVVKAVSIDSNGAGIDHAAFALSFRLLGLFFLGLCLCFSLGLFFLHFGLGLSLGSFLLHFSLDLFGLGDLCLGLFCRCGRSKHLLQRLDLVALGHNIKEHIELLLCEHLLAGLGLFIKFCDQSGDLLGRDTKILGHFTNAIFQKTTHIV